MLVAAAFAVAFALGFTGFLSEGHDVGDSIYRAIGLFILQGGETTEAVWQLELARFLAPITLSTATIRGLVSLARSNFGVIGGRLFGSGHLILISDSSEAASGELGLATLVRSDGYLKGRDLVLVAPDADKLERALRIAGADRSSEVAIALDTDEATLATVHRVQMIQRSSETETCVPIRAEIRNRRVWSELQRVDFAGGSGTTWFNRDEVVAQMIGRSLRTLSPNGTVKCSTDPEIARIAAKADDVAGTTFELEPSGTLVDQGLVCHRRAAETLEGAAATAARIRPGGTLTAICSGELGEVIERIGLSSGVKVSTIDPSNWLANWVDVSAEEMVAQAVHEEYRRVGLAAGWLAPDDPAASAWDDLPEALRKSNRSAARAIAAKLDSRGLVIRPRIEDASDGFEFSEDELEDLAVSEHDRWCAERTASGWTVGERDIAAKTTPNLVPWDKLSDVEKDKDRDLVRAIPSWLRRFGYEIHR